MLISITAVTYHCNGLLFKGKIEQMTVQNASILRLLFVPCI